MRSILTLFLGFSQISISLALNIATFYIKCAIYNQCLQYIIDSLQVKRTEMLQVHFSNVTFAQSAKYVMIIKNKQETKRSQVCGLWTSVPTFNEPILIDTLQDIVIKACSATIDRKLTVIGSFKILPNEINEEGEVMFDGQKNISQIVEDKEVCVGNCYVKIVKKKGSMSQSAVEFNDIDEEFELRSQESAAQEEEQEQVDEKDYCQLRFIIHGGFDFYLNAGFKVCINWGKKRGQTKLITNRITPFWGKNMCIKGRQDKILQMSIIDNKNSKLEWLKLDPKQIRIMYPYHLHIKFREQYVGLHPHFYITIIREDVPLYSILDKKINLKIKYIGPAAPQRIHQYLLICSRDIETNKQNSLPQFIDLDMKNYISFDAINKTIQKSPQKRYEWTNWNLLVPINLYPQQGVKEYVSLLKSFLNKSLICLYFSLDQIKGFFTQQIWNHATVLDKKDYFQNCVKELYYKEKRIVMGKAVQISNLDSDGIQNEKSAVSLQQKWKILTHNYELRKQMLSKSIDVTQSTKKQIKQKGEYLQHLKKILIEVKKMNQIMIRKQKSSLLENTKVSKKIRQNFNQYSTVQIISLLFEKQIQLEKRKKINDQMRMRMDSLHYFNEDSQQLDKIIVENAQKLLEQQTKMKQLKKIKQTIPKQTEVIFKLEKIFQKRQIDREMNELLQKNQDKLNQMKKAASKNLQKVYAIVKDHKNSPNSLLDSIKAAQSELIALNARYAKLTTA